MVEKVHKMLGIALHHATSDTESDHAFQRARTHMRDNKLAYSDIVKSEPCEPLPAPKPTAPKPTAPKPTASKPAAPSRGGKLAVLIYKRNIWTLNSARKDAISRFGNQKMSSYKINNIAWGFTVVPKGVTTSRVRDATIGEDHDIHAIYVKKIN